MNLKDAYLDDYPPSGHFMDYYSIRAYCSNCGKFLDVYIRKGIPKQNVKDNCPNCKVGPLIERL